MLIFVSDPTYSVLDTIEDTFSKTKLGDFDYKFEGNFSGLADMENYSWLSMPITGGSSRQGLIYDRIDSYVKVFVDEDDFTNWDNSNVNPIQATGHAISCRNYVLGEIDGVIVDSNVFVANWLDNYTGFNGIGFNIITRSTTGLSNSLTESALIENCNDADIGWVYAHGSNSHVELTNISRLDIVSAVGAGNNAGNQCSYGDGLEFYLNCEDYGISVAESWATAVVGGMIAKLLENHATWNFHDARQALRQNASNWNTGWIADGGFGALTEDSYTNANAMQDSELLSMSPLRKEITINGLDVEMSWKNSPQSNFSKTTIVKYSTEPDRDTTPDDGIVVYENTGESYTYTNTIPGHYWFVFHTKDSNGNYSKTESFDKYDYVLSGSELKSKINGIRNPLLDRWK